MPAPSGAALTDGGADGEGTHTQRRRPLTPTFVPVGLGPEDPADVSGPGALHLLRQGLQEDGVALGPPPPEPDLKLQPGGPGGLGQAHVCRLQGEEPGESCRCESGPRCSEGSLTLKDCL